MKRSMISAHVATTIRTCQGVTQALETLEEDEEFQVLKLQPALEIRAGKHRDPDMFPCCTVWPKRRCHSFGPQKVMILDSISLV